MVTTHSGLTYASDLITRALDFVTQRSEHKKFWSLAVKPFGGLANHVPVAPCCLATMKPCSAPGQCALGTGTTPRCPHPSPLHVTQRITDLWLPRDLAVTLRGNVWAWDRSSILPVVETSRF